MSSYCSKTLVAAIACGLSLSCAAARVDVTAGQTVSLDMPGGLSSPLTLTTDNVAVLHFSNGTGDSIHGVPRSSVGGWVHFVWLTEQTLGGVEGATLQETILPVGVGIVRNLRARIALTSPVKSVGIDQAAGRIESVHLLGGLGISAPLIRGLSDGGWGQFSNMTIDLVDQKIYADMWANWGQPYEYREQQSALFTFDAVSGPTVLPGADPLQGGGWDITEKAGLRTFAATHTITRLKLTDSGRLFFVEMLGLQPGSTGASALDSYNALPESWGALTYSVSFTSPVPEPSSLMLAAGGLGLVAVAQRARRRRACV